MIKAELLTETTVQHFKRMLIEDIYGFQEKHNGCVEYRTKISMVDGSYKRIHQIQIGDWVLGVDADSNVVPSKVTAIFNNGKTSTWTNVRCNKTSAGRGKAFAALNCTSIHRFWRPELNDYSLTSALKVGESQITTLRHDLGLTPIQEQILLGKLLGDGTLNIERSNVTARISWGHSVTDKEYIDWARRGLSSIMTPTTSQHKSGYGSDMLTSSTICNAWILKTFQSFLKKDKKVVPAWVEQKLTPLAIAFWYMDDGSLVHNEGQDDRAQFATCAFSPADLAVLQRGLFKFDIHAEIGAAGEGYPLLVLNSVEAEKLFLLIAPYIPVSMQRKLPVRYRGHEGWLPEDIKNPFKPVLVNQVVTLVEERPVHYKNTRLSPTKYDIETETHNYFANKILVHNSRQVICKQNGTLRAFNREGEPSNKPLPSNVKLALLAHHLDTFVVDGELVKNTYHVFDALFLGNEELIHDGYEYREARYHSEFEGYSPYIQPVKTARTPQEKKALWERVEGEQGEGVVSKNMTKSYKQGRSENHWKLKFTKECDVVVMGLSPEGKDSVEIGVYNERGQLHRVSGCSLRGKFRVAVGDVLTVRYLYSTRENHIVQPVLIHKRTDKKAETCDIHQLVKNKNFLVPKSAKRGKTGTPND